MTQLKTMDPLRETRMAMLDPQTLREATERYLANPIFQAARYEELVVDDNPYRRPVRPDDIGLVDFSEPLSRDNFTQLSGLMGHRMLLNIFDTRKLILPTRATESKWRDFDLFYSQANRMLGDVIGPYLEEHLFGFVRDEAEANVTERPDALRARVDELSTQRTERAERTRSLVAASPSRDAMRAMLAIQAVGASLNLRYQPSMRLPVGSGTAPALPAPTNEIETIADTFGVKVEPHSYFQFYLPSSLALMNYVNACAQDPGRVFRLVGALLAHEVDAAASRGLLDDGAPQPLPEGWRSIVATAETMAGPYGLKECSRGLEEYAVLLDLYDEDVRRQFTWIDAMPAYREKAERLQRAIDEHEIPVALDTFVESWEECSTTHVHDEDRLLVIESGEMEFWNCFGVRHKYRPGDKAFIPKHRLHGSVVLTGECVYHQPVITKELDARFG